MVCHYCGHRSSAMVEAARHDVERPESCAAWRDQLNRLSVTDQVEVETILQSLIVRGGGNLDQALDDYYERIERVYR